MRIPNLKNDSGTAFKIIFSCLAAGLLSILAGAAWCQGNQSLSTAIAVTRPSHQAGTVAPGKHIHTHHPVNHQSPTHSTAVAKTTNAQLPNQFLNQLAITRGAVDAEHGLSEFRIKSNGLSVLLAQRHAAPVVTVMMLYRVGSRNEAVGYTGATHFLEHLMFKGSSHFDPRKHTGIDDVLKPIGGLNNATTWFDRTAYYEVLPSRHLDLALAFEADRMRHLLLRSSDRTSEMTVVRNELERGENDPRDLLETQMFAAAYTQHPYHHPTIGWRCDVEGVSLQRLKQFHDDFYWPNNATLLIIGDIDPAATLKLVASRFGTIPHSPRPIPSVYTTEPPQEGERHFQVQRGNDLPRVEIAFHTCPSTNKDIYALAVIENLLGDSSKRSSRLYKGLIDSGLASDCYAENYELRDPGLFMVSAVATTGTKPAALETALTAAIERLKTQLVSTEELNQSKSSICKRLTLSTMDPLAMAEQIGEAVAAVDWKFWSTYDQQIKAVTADDINRVANRYFQSNNCTIGYYLPKAPSAVANQPEPATAASTSYIDIPNSKSAIVKAKSQASSSFAQRIKRKVLPNGLTVLAMPIPNTGVVAVCGKIRAGDYFAGPEKDLVPELLSDMLTRGSQNYTQGQLANQLDNMGSSLDFEAGNFWMEFTSNVVSSDLGRFLPLLSDVLQKPTLSSDELAKTKKIVESELKQHMVETHEVACNSLAHAIYQPGAVYYQKTFQQKLCEVPTITAEDLSAFHKRQFSPANTVLAIIGDIDPEQAFALVQANLGNWKGPTKPTPISIPPSPQLIAHSPTHKITNEIADKENVDISIGCPSELSLKSKDYFAALIANAALGHSPFSTRLAPIREKYGLTYDICSAFMDPAYGGGPWTIECSVNPQNIDRALALIYQILKDYTKNGITQAEVATEAKHLAGELMVSLRNPDDIGKYITEYEMLGLSMERLDQFSQHLQAVTPQQVDQAIKTYFDLDKAVTTIAGTLNQPSSHH